MALLIRFILTNSLYTLNQCHCY